MTAGSDAALHDSKAVDAPAAPPAGRRRVSIRVLVVLLMLALITPAALLIGYTVVRVAAEREADVARRGEYLADEIADRLEIEFRTSATLLAVFASSGWLEEGQYRLLHQRAQRALAGTDRYLIVLDDDFRQLLNTRVSFDDDLGTTSNIEAARQAFEESDVIVSDLFRGSVAETTVYNVMRRATLPDGTKRVLILTRSAADLRPLFGQAPRATGWSFALLDGARQAALSVTGPAEAGSALPAACLETNWGFRRWGGSGVEHYVFSKVVDRSSWSVCVWGSTERLLERAGSFWTLVLAGTVGWSLLALAAAAGLSTALSRAVSRTAEVGEALDRGQPVAVARSFISEVDDVRQSLAGAAAERLQKDEEMRLIMRETAHRARNQMALAISLLNLAARSARSVKELKEDVTNRLMAVGRSVDVLASRQSDAAPLGQLVRAQLEPFVDDTARRLRIEGEELLLSPAASQALSLVLHELATNAFKYGAWSVPDGSLEVCWSVGDGVLALTWSETGRGAAGRGESGFGTTLIEGLIRRDLGGSIDRTFGENGLSCRIEVSLAAIAPASRSAWPAGGTT